MAQQSFGCTYDFHISPVTQSLNTMDSYWGVQVKVVLFLKSRYNAKLSVCVAKPAELINVMNPGHFPEWMAG